MLSTVMLLGLTLVAAVTAAFRNKIYNWNTYGGILAGLALSAAHSDWPWGWLGGPSLAESVGGFLTCGVLMVACFVFFPGISGGDVKLMAMVGAWLGTKELFARNDALEALLWTFVLAACFGLIGLVWRVGPFTTVSRVVRMMGTKMRLPWFMPLSEEEHKALQRPLFLAPSALVAVVIVRFGIMKYWS